MRANSAYRAHALAFIFCLAGLLVLLGGFNHYFDPLMSSNVVRPANRIVPVIDARLQKTNRLLEATEGYDSVLLGSSRVEQFRQEDFAPQHAFNYAVPLFYPDEAEGYLDLFLRTNPGKTEVVFLGLDFFGTNARAHSHARPPSFYISSSCDPLSHLKASLSRDTFMYSLRMARHEQERFKYNRITLDKLTQSQSSEESETRAIVQREVYKNTLYGDYCYNEAYSATLRQLKRNHPDLRFVAFTTPETADLFGVMVRCGRLPDYERWLKEVVDVFGQVHHFALIDRFTTDRSNFLDADHLYPERTAPLARILRGQPLPEDQGIERLVTAGNLSSCLEEIRATAKRFPEEKLP